METTGIGRENIILSADDFGQSAVANKNISELVKLGKIHRVAVLIDGFVAKEEMDELWSHGAKVDIHLTLPEGLRKRGGFVRRIVFFLKNHALKKNDLVIIKNNWERQIEKFMKIAGRIPDGLNSHEYVHFYPPYFRLAMEISDKYGIQYVRFGKKGIIGNFNIVFLILRWLHDSNKKTFFSAPKNSSDYIVSLDWMISPDNFLDKLPTGEVEIICHPERKKEYELIKKYF